MDSKKKETVPQREINWDKLDTTKLYVVGAGIFTGITVVLYPVSLVKTRMQVASKNYAQKSAFDVVRNILKADGIQGLYRGFGVVITFTVPARIIFLTSFETTKITAIKMVEQFKLSEPVQAALTNGLGGMAASISSQAVFVPIDVVSQKLMVKGYSGYANYTGGFDVARKIMKADGIRGFYRGFGLSAMTYAPSSAVWWATYGSSQHIIWNKRYSLPLNTSTAYILALCGRNSEHEEFVSSPWKLVFVQASGGVISGAMASCVTTPLDTIKTRLQVMDIKQRQTTRQIVKNLIAEDGWKGLYRGLGPRAFVCQIRGFMNNYLTEDAQIMYMISIPSKASNIFAGVTFSTRPFNFTGRIRLFRRQFYMQRPRESSPFGQFIHHC